MHRIAQCIEPVLIALVILCCGALLVSGVVRTCNAPPSPDTPPRYYPAVVDEVGQAQIVWDEQKQRCYVLSGHGSGGLVVSPAPADWCDLTNVR